MQYMQLQQLNDLVQLRHAELLREAEQLHQAKQLQPLQARPARVPLLAWVRSVSCQVKSFWQTTFVNADTLTGPC